MTETYYLQFTHNGSLLHMGDILNFNRDALFREKKIKKGGIYSFILPSALNILPQED